METCTVGELIEALRQYDEDMPVVASSDYGDRAHTAQAIPILTEEIDDGMYLTESAYSDSCHAVTDDPEHAISQVLCLNVC